MPQPLSLDLRHRIAAGVEGGGTVRAVAARFGVSVATAVRLGQKARAGLDLTPRKPGGPGCPVLVGAVAVWVRERLRVKPDLTMRALASELDARGTPASHDTVWRFVRQQGLTVKKNAGGQRAGAAGHRAVPSALEGLPASHRA